MDNTLGDKIPEFNKKPGAGGNVGLSGASFSLGDHRTKFETFIIILVAVIIIGCEFRRLWFGQFISRGQSPLGIRPGRHAGFRFRPQEAIKLGRLPPRLPAGQTCLGLP